jgi:hypothetical protein
LRDSPNIEQVLGEFLTEEKARLAPRTYRNYEYVVELLQHCLNDYGPNYLDPSERSRWEKAYETDDEAFCHLFGPEKIADCLGEFLGYFMIRKVMAGEELLRAAGTVTKKLAKWLGQRQLLSEAAAAASVERGAEAGRDLPRAERLSRLLYEQSRRVPIDVRSLSDDDYIEDYLMIERVEPKALWFEGSVGPVPVPKEATDLAKEGWSVNVVLGRKGKTWHVLEVGNVYP